MGLTIKKAPELPYKVKHHHLFRIARLNYARQDLASTSQHSDRRLPIQLVSTIVEALRSGRTVTRSLDQVRCKSHVHSMFWYYSGPQFNAVQLSLESSETLSVADRVFIRKTMPNILACMTRLQETANEVTSTFKRYKLFFYLLLDAVGHRFPALVEGVA